jgi:pyrrolysine biosynthesis protein PylD
MTRVTTDDIHDICGRLVQYDRRLVTVTGRTLLGIGAWATGLADVAHLKRVAHEINMAVVPIRSGLGIVCGFTEAVCGILAHLGFDAWVTGHSDVAGFAEAVDMGGQVIFAADDDRFVAFCPRQEKIVDNSRSTARGFVAGLDLMAGGLAGKNALVLGCGPVGRWAAEALLMRKARVRVVDRVAEKAADLAGWARDTFHTTIQVAADPDQALLTHHLILDATNSADVIRAHHVTENTRVAAPGMPCGIAPRARDKMVGRLLHDPLQIGVATMACEALRIIDTQRLLVGPPVCDGASA